MKILFNAQIYCFDNQGTKASVIVVDHGRVIAVGDEALLESFGSRVDREDMAGRVILPGLTDAHFHLMHYALSLKKVDVETESKQEALRRVAAQAAEIPAGEWVLGHGWQQNDWGGDFPTAAELDAVAPDHPVYLTSKSLHSSWLNTVALKRAGIGAFTSDPENGKIVRDESGKPNGILLETAMDLVNSAIPTPTAAEICESIETAIPKLWQYGLTGIHDFDYRPAFVAMQMLDGEKKLKFRVTKSVPLELLPHAAALGLRTGFGSEYLRIGSVKLFMDGALGPRTAAMLAPYLNEPENRGILNMDGEQFFEYGRQAAGAGLSITGHAIGDRAVHEILDGFEQLRSYERDNRLPALRHRIEHVQIIHPDDAGRLGRMGIIASMQPIHATSDMYAAEKYWGQRAELAYAWRTQLNYGAVLAFGSDAPVETPNPFLGLYSAITRKRAHESAEKHGWHVGQCLTRREAMEAYTIGPAFAAMQENELGRLLPGYYADLIVLEKDPFTCEPDELPAMHPVATMLAGEWVWQG